MTRKPIRSLALVVRAVLHPQPDVKLIYFADPDDWELPPFRPGAHVDLELPPIAGRRTIRTYSLCNAPHESGRYVVAVKRDDRGRGGSRLIHERFRPGEAVNVSLPREGLSLHADGTNVFLAGGIGVTPFVSAIRHLERLGRTNYHLHWSSNGPASLVAEIEPARLAGRVTLYDTTQGPLPDIAAIVAGHDADAALFCCGPEPMLQAFEQATAGRPADRVHVERFGGTPVAADPDARPFTVRLARSGIAVAIAPGDRISDRLLDAEAPIPFSCEGGVCGLCRTRWLEGEPVHNDRVLTDEERRREVIVCVAGCRSDELVLDA